MEAGYVLRSVAHGSDSFISVNISRFLVCMPIVLMCNCLCYCAHVVQALAPSKWLNFAQLPHRTKAHEGHISGVAGSERSQRVGIKGGLRV